MAIHPYLQLFMIYIYIAFKSIFHFHEATKQVRKFSIRAQAFVSTCSFTAHDKSFCVKHRVKQTSRNVKKRHANSTR